MVKVLIRTPQGDAYKELTAQERAERIARFDDYACKKEVCKEKIAKALSLQDELDAIKELLGL